MLMALSLHRFDVVLILFLHLFNFKVNKFLHHFVLFHNIS